MNITFEDVKNNKEFNTYIMKGNELLGALGFTEHSFAHVNKVSVTAARILRELGYEERTIELARIAGYIHDIGNMVNRVDHAQTGALMAFTILTKMGMDPEDIADVAGAIGNHDEGAGIPVSPIAAALILADKTDVRRSRVRNLDIGKFDIHDRVNYAVEKSELVIDMGNKIVRLEMKIDTKICSLMDYFEIFLVRMLMCRRAAEFLNIKFELMANGSKLL
ncbi:MAG: HD domain-containing protein [Epulopiscium sp.]|nr:HD domain-containing protein [Candidatus Epulonipiscium sp.]